MNQVWVIKFPLAKGDELFWAAESVLPFGPRHLAVQFAQKCDAEAVIRSGIFEPCIKERLTASPCQLI